MNPIIDRSVVKRLNLSAIEASEMVRKYYPELNQEGLSPWLERLYKGRRVVIVKRRKFGTYRFHRHSFWRTEYAAKNAEGRWVFVGRLADFDLGHLPV